MLSRVGWGAAATGAVRRMQPDSASAVMAAIIDRRNARATRTGAIPQSETALVLHPLWLTNGFERDRSGLPRPALAGRGLGCGAASANSIHRVRGEPPHPDRVVMRSGLSPQAGRGEDQSIKPR